MFEKSTFARLLLVPIAIGMFLLPHSVFGQIFHTDGFNTPSNWTLNSIPATMAPVQGANDPAFNPWIINALDFFTPSGPIQGNSLKITIQPGTDFDGLGLSANYAGYDPFNVNESNITDAVALMSTDVSTVGRFGITLEFDYQTGGWLGNDFGTVVYSTDGGVSWTELDNSFTVAYTNINANNQPSGPGGTAPAAPPNTMTQNAFSNIDGFFSGTLWHRASVVLPPACDNIANFRLGFRWRNISNVINSPDYLGVSFNIDNIALRVAPPIADFTWTPMSLCAGPPATFDPSASSPGGGSSITGWIWTFSGGTPSTSTQQNPVVFWSNAGMDTVTLRVINNLGDTSLVSSQYIFINDCQPEARIASSHSVCQDSIITFQDLSSNTGAAFAPVSWAWTFAGGTPATANTQGPHNVSFNTVGPHTVTLTVTNIYGSDDTTITVSVADCSCGALSAGAPIFVEDFDGNGSTGSNWITSPLNQDIGVQGTSANLWYISDEENGNAVGACGSANGGNNTLHLSALVPGDVGAAYEIGCTTGCFFCDFFTICISSGTDRRSQSQDINTVGRTNLVMDFKYMEAGDGALDDATVEYSSNGGVSWNPLANPAKTALSCFPQGIWTALSVPLPVACENIPNLRIAFRWVNNEDAVGDDPSFAVDNIVINGTGGSLPKSWVGVVSDDWHVGANWSDGLVPTAADNILVPDAATLTSFCPGCVMPQIYAGDGLANDVCNYGTITIHDAPTKRTLTVFGALLNEGAITTTSNDPQFDVIMRGLASTYAGTGTNIDTDYQIQSGQTTLLSDISCRTFQISADFDWSIYRITVKRNFFRTTGSVTSTATSTLYMDGPGTGFDTDPSQQFGSNITLTIPNLIVDKPSGIVTLSTGAIHSISQRMTIIQGIVDAGTRQITGAGDLYMYDGEFRLARTGGTVPQITGGYFLTGGLVQLYGAGAQTLRGPRSYYELEFTGTGVKTLGGNTDVQQHLYLNEPAAAGNYVDAQGFSLHDLNSDPASITYTGGHVVGNLQRTIVQNGTYRFHTGSDGASTVTYYEPMDIQMVGLTGTNDITVAFNKNIPSPLAVTPPLTELGATFTTMETEGFWEVNPDVQPFGGTFTVTEYPSAGWVFSNTSYTQVRQDVFGSQWTWNGSSRVTALKRQNYPSFSNFGIASSNQPLPVEGLVLQAAPEGSKVRLTWETSQEVNTSHFEIERSLDGDQFVKIGEVTAGGDLPEGANYRSLDPAPLLGTNFYRLRQVDLDGRYAWSNTVLVNFGEEAGIEIFPNPAQNQVQIRYSGAANTSVDLTIQNALGQMILQRTVSTNLTLDVGQLARGIYLVTLHGQDGRRWTQKLVLE